MLRRSRLLLTLLLALYGVACLRSPDAGSLLAGVDLAIHETGHLVFSPFGELVGFMGGTLGQLIMPSVFVVYFWRRGDRHAATVPLWWVAQNLWNISVYAADARAQLLPLVGGGEHDWAYMLGRLGWLSLDVRISRLIWLSGVAIYVTSIVQGIRYARVISSDSEPVAASAP
jgi:hypothetical protein